MFTGIVEEIGVVNNLVIDSKSSKLSILANKVIEGTNVGDSIATNGVCLTVTEIGNDYFVADVMGETFNRTNLGTLKKGQKVNLERALSLQSRLGGHIVSGHIDGTGIIQNKLKDKNAIWITINVGCEILKYIVEKGSIAIDGVSLTVAYVDDCCFKVSIIPHTVEQTILTSKMIGEKVNLECDVLAKYVEKMINTKAKNEKQNSISEEFLKLNGFI